MNDQTEQVLRIATVLMLVAALVIGVVWLFRDQVMEAW
jgi:hypothetical protein